MDSFNMTFDLADDLIEADSSPSTGPGPEETGGSDNVLLDVSLKVKAMRLRNSVNLSTLHRKPSELKQLHS